MDKTGSACVYGKGSNNTENLSACVIRLDTPAMGAEATENFANQAVAKNEKKHYGPFPVKPGSVLEVKLSGASGNAGDPDLYVDFSRKPELKRWVCRPYLSHANETCELQVPSNRSQVFVMVRGYSAASYQLNVKYVKPN